MTCREFVGFLMDYLNGEVSPQQRQAFEEHLAECDNCVAYLQNYRETIRLGQGVFGRPDDPVPADVPEDLVQAILAVTRQTSTSP
jgi:anti-sigma factor RsiW